ncbi:hypothetical protein FB451DRAFT_1501259 [Mycena latifolia]|nr:hypothetical protein FB451DRAFT_1501259 [Mycena latifolia]
MASLSETSLSLITSTPPTSGTTKVVIGVLVLVITVCIMHHASPMRLTSIMVAAIAATEQTYLEAVEAGVLSTSDVHMAATLTSLQIKVSTIREASLRNSLSYRGPLCGFFNSHTLTVFRCIQEVQSLETHIEVYISYDSFSFTLNHILAKILREKELRDVDPRIEKVTATRAVSLRGKQKHSPRKV